MRANSPPEFPAQKQYNTHWLADFSPLDGELPEHEQKNFDLIKRDFPKAKAGKRSSKGGALYWYLIDPITGPMAGPLG